MYRACYSRLALLPRRPLWRMYVAPMSVVGSAAQRRLDPRIAGQCPAQADSQKCLGATGCQPSVRNPVSSQRRKQEHQQRASKVCACLQLTCCQHSLYCQQLPTSQSISVMLKETTRDAHYADVCPQVLRWQPVHPPCVSCIQQAKQYRVGI